jgi:zinc protease
MPKSIFQTPNMNFKKPVFLLIAASLITTATFAQVKKKPTTAHKATPAATKQAAIKPTLLPVDPDVIVGKLPNGLTYYIRKNSTPKGRADLILVNKAGSVLETDAQQGLSPKTI